MATKNRCEVALGTMPITFFERSRHAHSESAARKTAVQRMDRYYYTREPQIVVLRIRPARLTDSPDRTVATSPVPGGDASSLGEGSAACDYAKQCSGE